MPGIGAVISDLLFIAFLIALGYAISKALPKVRGAIDRHRQALRRRREDRARN
jgi:hypothetical protein